MRCSAVAVAALASAASAQVYQGFNYGSTFTTGAAKQQSDFEAEFNAARGLVGHSGFTSARIYTMIQAGTANQPISAISAAIATKTSLLLGLWASAGQAAIDQEITALNAAIMQYGSAFTDLIAGISVGSEDLYRITPTGIANKAGVGASPAEVASYINQVRSNVSSTIKAPIGHVDTWTAWVNGSNSAVVEACDFIGVDAYPYFQTVNANGIENGESLFFEAYHNTINAAQGKPVWVTESGWPVSGPQENQAVASPQNAKAYWDAVACKLLGTTNTWWYTLQDAEPDTPSPSFGLVGAGALGAHPQPLYDLSCSASSSASGSASGSPPASSASPSASGSAPAVTPSAGGEHAVGGGTTEITGADGTITVRSTSWSTVTACPTAADQDMTVTLKSTAYVTACPECDKSSMPAVIPSQGPTTPVSSGTPAPAPTPSASSSACPADLKGEYQYPHLIIPVDKSQPEKAEGTSYFGYVNSTVSTIFNFDIPQSYAGKTCTLVFLFPEKSQLETSDYTLASAGGLSFTALGSPANQQTTYNNQPKSVGTVGTVSNLTPGNSYTITSQSCPAGSAIAYEISAIGGINLNYFQDWNPSPLGLFIRTC